MKFGDLLVKLGLVSEPDLRDALVVAPQFGLPIGRTLVLSGRLTEEELEVAIELQALINQSNYSVEQARTVAASVRQGTPPALALKNAGVEDSAEKTTLGQLLQESGLINAQQLDTAQKASYRSGMRLGRMLVLNGVITHAQLARALDVQFSIRERKITMQQGISMLQAQASQPVAYEAHQLRPAPAQKNVRFSEFLVLSGLLTDAVWTSASVWRKR
jgi:ABC-type transporter Mla MlaB component